MSSAIPSRTVPTGSLRALLTLVATGLLLAPGAASAEMLTASLKAEYPVAPAVVWERIGEFASLADWHPMVTIATVEGSGVGAVRTVTWSNGATLVEKLTEITEIDVVDDENACAVRGEPGGRGVIGTVIVETSLSIVNYASQLRVEQGPDPGTSIVTWSSTFEAEGIDDAEAVEMMTDYYKEGLSALATIVE